MRTGIKIGLVFGGLVLVTGGVIGYAVWRAQSKPKNVAIKSEVTNTSQAVNLNAGQSSVNGLSVTGDSGLGNGLSGNSSQSGQSSDPGQSKVPGPETFGQFDKYKSEKNALFQDLQPGTGEEIKLNKKAAIIYQVYLTNGKLVDQNQVDKDKKVVPFVFTEGAHQVIPGLEQGVGGMKVGGVRRIIIPPSVGYGAQGKDPIPPNAVLIFDTQLLEVEK